MLLRTKKYNKIVPHDSSSIPDDSSSKQSMSPIPVQKPTKRSRKQPDIIIAEDFSSSIPSPSPALTQITPISSATLSPLHNVEITETPAEITETPVVFTRSSVELTSSSDVGGVVSSSHDDPSNVRDFEYKIGIEPDKLSKLNKHPRDDRITFDEPTHTYFIDGDSTSVISVTTFIHKMFPEFDADAIISKMMNGKNWRNSKYFGMTRDEIKASWDANKNEASDAGTRMHFDIECYYNDIPSGNDSIEYRYFCNFLKEFERMHPGARAFRTEWRVFDESIKLSGSIDMVFICPDGQLMIYDWKRCREIKRDNRFERGEYPLNHLPNTNYWHYSMQLNTYRRILENKYGYKVKELALVVLHPSNPDFVLIKLPFLDREVDSMWRHRQSILDGTNNLRSRFNPDLCDSSSEGNSDEIVVNNNEKISECLIDF